MNRKICLIVDDDEMLRSRMARAFESRGLTVWTAANYDEALARVADAAPDMALIDLKMPGKSGLELLQALKTQWPATDAVVLTGYGSIANAVEAVRAGALNYVTKPADASEILAAFGIVEEEPSAAASSAAKPRTETLHAPSLAEAEWNHIQRVLAECQGNISAAARQLDIPRRTLQRKLKKLAP